MVENQEGDAHRPNGTFSWYLKKGRSPVGPQPFTLIAENVFGEMAIPSHTKNGHVAYLHTDEPTFKVSV
jgi:uncharacterized protein YozE (UPF0346 family)